MNKSMLSILMMVAVTESALCQEGIPTPTKNYIRIESPYVATTVTNSLSTLPPGSKSSVIEYFDTKGRMVQMNRRSSSPSGKDLITLKLYDEFGRESGDYLPYTIAANSQFRANAIVEQKAFYNGTAGVAIDNEPYTKLIYDNSPLKQVKKSYAVGWNWHTDPESFPESMTRKVNAEGEVYLIRDVMSGLPEFVVNRYYPAGSLWIEETISESKVITKVYRNSKEQIVLKRTGDGTIWLDTYYIFDISGHISYIFPPEASARLTEYASTSEKQKFVDTWCYYSKLDEYGRTIARKVPGSSVISMIYDKYDRLVLIQDGNQRAMDQWTFTKYDVFNRPIITGLTTGSEVSLRDLARTATAHHEVRESNSIGYSNICFPAHSTSNVESVQYYDDYSFLAYPEWDGEKNSFGVSAEPDVIDASRLFTSTVKGYATGSKVKIGSQSKWINSVMYYDYDYNVIQSITENALGGKDIVSTKYHPFHGKVLMIKRRHTSSTTTLTTMQEFSYDHAVRLATLHYTINGGPRILMASHRYNELGQLIEKNIHSTDGAKFLQSIDMRYNIQGWRTHINNASLTNDGVNNNDTDDLFGMELLFNQAITIGNPSVTLKKRFTGTPSAIRWKTNTRQPGIVGEEKIYGFEYDGFQRFLTARYAAKSGTTWTAASGTFDEMIYHHDRNGNIGAKTSTVGLSRNGKINGAKAEIDNLLFRYDGNKTMAVIDNISNPSGFVDKLKAPISVDDYRYDNNGNIVEDFNKLITKITYNRLNLPVEVQFTRTDLTPSRTETIQNVYDANGVLLKRTIDVGGRKVWTTEFSGGIQYDNGRISFFTTPEGRAVQLANNQFEHEYFFKDNQQNVRVVYGIGRETIRHVATLEPALDNQERVNYTFKNISETRAIGNNFTRPNEVVTSPNYSSRCNGYTGLSPIGPAKEIRVLAGDAVYMEVYARYNVVNTTPSTVLASALALGLTRTFNIVRAENAILFDGISQHGPLTAAAVPGNAVTPKAYLAYLFFNDQNVFQRSGAIAITTGAYNAFEKLSRSFTADMNGRLYIYVANESSGSAASDVFFDDMTVVHEKGIPALQVFQATDYYPYGLKFNEFLNERLIKINTAQGIAYEPLIHNRYLFQDQELCTDLGLNWYQYKFRMYDPTIARFTSVDPLAWDYPANSPYAFSENKVTGGVELEGLELDQLYQLAKRVSPFAMNISFEYSSHAKKIGFEMSIGAPQIHPYSERLTFGFTRHWQNPITQKAFDEVKTGREINYFGLVTVGQTKYSGGGIDQTTGSVMVGVPFLNVEYENDWFPKNVANVLDPFNRFAPHIGDGGDRFRTAALRANVGILNAGFNLATGDPTDAFGKRQSDPFGGRKGTYVPRFGSNPDQYRLGLGYVGMGPLRIGMNSEQIRHQIQNVFTHDAMGMPWFQVQPTPPQFYFGVYSGSQW